MKAIIQRIQTAAILAVLAAGGAWATDYTGTNYAPWSYSAGCVVWRATSGQLFHKSTIADVAAGGTIGSSYDLDTTGHPWTAFANNGGGNYTAPGLTLVFDEAGYNGSSDAQFAPLSFGGLWVKVLQATDTPYCITDNKTDGTIRTVELGATGASTYFKFEKSFTFDRNSPTTVKGTATVDIASGATFTINARANKGAVVESGNTLVLAGSGTLAVTGGLTIGGTLDISAASVPTISGDVTLSAGCTIVLPASAELNTAISIPVATTVTAGSIIWAKIGANDAVRVVPTVESGAITYLDTNVEFTYYSTDEYPTTIPDDGCIYNFVGGESANAATTFAGVTVNGILKTRGYVNLTDFTLNVGGTHEVVSETTTVTAAWNSSRNYGYVSGNITIDAGATYAVTQTDTINWANSGVQKIDIYGTLALGTHRWSIMGVDHCVFNLYPGARITGTGDANGLLDLFATTSKLNCYAGSAGGDIYVEGLLKTRNANTPIWIAANTTLHLQGGLTGGGIAKSGAGTLALSGTIASTVANSSVTDGTFALVDATGTALPLTVNANKSVTVSSSSGVTVPLNVTMAGGSSITVAGAGTVNGTVTMNALPGTTTDLTAASWAGTVSLAALSNPANVSVLQKLGSENSTLVLKGISSSAYIAASGNTTYTIACPIRLDGAVVIDNGSSGSTINLGKIFGTGNLTIAEWNGCSSIRYNLNAIDIDNYSGTLTLANNNLRAAGGTMTIGFGNLIKSNAAVGSVILPITTTAVENTTGTIAYNFDAGKVNGTAKNLCVDIVNGVFGVYIAAASYSSTKYATVQAAIDAAEQASQTYAAVTILDPNATCPNEYYIDNGTLKKKPASITVGENVYYYTTIQAAVQDALPAPYGSHSNYDYLTIYESNTAVAMMDYTLKLATAPGVTGVTVSLPVSFTTTEYAVSSVSGDTYTTYSVSVNPKTYRWKNAAAGTLWTTASNWEFQDNETWTSAQRYPGDGTTGDSVVVTDDTSIQLGNAVTLASLQVTDGTLALAIPSQGTATTLTASAITLASATAAISVTDVSLSPVPTTSVADSYVKETGDTTKTYTVDAYNTVTFAGDNYTLGSVTTNGAEVAISEGTCKVEDGAITFTVDPNSGYAVTGVTAGGDPLTADNGTYFYTVTQDATITVTTDSTSLTIGEASFDYNATYATAKTVTAQVAGYVVSGTTTFTLTAGGTTYTGSYDNGTVTFQNVAVDGLGSTTSYTITATGGSTGTTGAQSATVGNAVDGSTWMKADMNTTAVGTWKDENDTPVTLAYTDGVATLVGTNIYTAAWTSTGEVVTVTTKVAFGSPADSALTVDADAQAAIRIGTEQGANVFQIYAGPTPSWVSVYNDTLGTPADSATYALTLTLNYAHQTFGVSVGDAGALTNAAGDASFPLAKAASSMQKISYRGAGTFTSLAGSYVSAGYSADVGTEGNATNVVVAQSFVSDYLSSVSASEISTYLNPDATSGKAATPNGLNYFKCYALGLDPTKEEDTPIVDVTTDANGKYVFTVKHRNEQGELVAITPADNVSTTVTLKYGTGANTQSWESAEGTSFAPSELPFGENNSVLYYKAEVTISAK